MNPKYKEFCQYYLFYNNLEVASSLSNYKLSTAKQLLKNPEVQDYLASMKYKIASSNEVMECLTSIMRGYPIYSVPSEDAFLNLSPDIHSQTLNFLNSMSSSSTTTPKPISTREQLKAAELIGKALSIFNPKALLSNSSNSINQSNDNLNQNIIFIGSDQLLE